MIEPTESFIKAHKFTALWEGGLSDDPYDSGGITKYGVSIKFLQDFSTQDLRDCGLKPPVTTDTIMNLTPLEAQRCLYLKFWKPYSLDEYTPNFGLLFYDYAMNCGAKMVIKRLQRLCNDQLGSDLTVDGILGPLTKKAFHELESRKACAQWILEDRRNRYRQIVANNPTQKRFLKGWLNRVEDLAERLK